MHVNCSRKIIISSKHLSIFYWMKINKYLQIFGKYMTNWFEIKHNLTFFLGFLFSYVLYFEGKTRRKWLTDMTLTWGIVPWPWPQVIFKIYPAYRFINLLQIVFAERRDFHIVSKIQSKQDSIIWFQNVPEDRFPWSRQPTVGWDHCFKVCRASFVLLFRF